MSTDVETIVIGAGIVGLAIARSLTREGQEVTVLEQHDRIGTETSSRNSEVIHAGIYYPPGSLRAKLCVTGKELLYDFAAKNDVAVRRCGKLLVATSADEVPKLAGLAATAKANGVGDLTQLSGVEARGMEPALACVAAYLSPSTGVIDSHGLMVALEGHVTSLGGVVVLNTRVDGIRREGDDFQVSAASAGEITQIHCRNLVIAAGLGATRLGRMLTYTGAYQVPATYPAKGHYFALSGRAPFERLIYPMPKGAWLGIHLTLDVAGQAKFGPDIEWRDNVSYNFEDAHGSRLATFQAEIRRYWPDLPNGALLPGYTGVRPKIYREGEPAADFAIHGEREHGVPRLVALYGIESPGLTSCLAIGDYVATALK